MSRYIDVDLLMPNAEHKGRYDVVSAYDIANTPTADVVEVVRCKDCIYSHTDIYYGEECLTCENTDGLCCDVYKEDYCSMGERRADEPRL